MSPLAVGAVIAIVTFAALVIRFDARLLKDLAQTADDELQFLTRKGWAVAIVAMFPFGPMCYLAYAKGPRRYC
jgi:hypothetical protein